jgi:hypothetical protein
MANGAFNFKDSNGNIVSFISGSGSDIIMSGGTLNLSSMTGLTLGNLTMEGTVETASFAPNYLLTSSFESYTGTTDTIIGSLQTSTSSLNSFTSSATTRLDNIETSTGSLNSFTSSATTRLNSIEGVSGSYSTTGSNQFKNDQVITGSLTVTGFIDAQELRTTYISSSILYRSGSTKFGDELSDTHAFTGSLLVSGTISVPGSNLISSSVQVDVMSTTNIARLATTGSNTFTGIQSIGTSESPTSGGNLLRVFGSGSATNMQVFTTTDHATFFEANTNSGSIVTRLQSQNASFVGTLTNNTFDIVAGGNVIIRTTGSGLVGINKSTTPNATLDVNGNALVSGSITMTTNTNSGSPINVRNTNAGTSAYSGIHIGNNDRVNGGGIVLSSTGYSGGAILGTDMTYIYNNGLGGIGINSEGNASIKFGTNGILAMTIDATQNIQMSGTGALTIPKGTTGQRPSAVSGMVRFNTTVGLPEVYTGTAWIYMSALNGLSAETAAPSASVIKSLNPDAPNGVYWLKFGLGSNTAFQAYIIFDKPDGPWVKAVQWFNNTDLSGSNGINAGGSWTSSQIALSAGKIPSADINILKSSLSTLWRVTGSGDPLMNYGAGALKINWSFLPNWGTDHQPTTSQPYDFYIDATNDGIYEHGYRYVPTLQARCNHVSSIWVSDHNSPVGAGSMVLLGTKASTAGYPICWTVGATSWYTNLHPWTGISAESGGSLQFGSASTAAALYFKN